MLVDNNLFRLLHLQFFSPQKWDCVCDLGRRQCSNAILLAPSVWWLAVQAACGINMLQLVLFQEQDNIFQCLSMFPWSRWLQYPHFSRDVPLPGALWEQASPLQTACVTPSGGHCTEIVRTSKLQPSIVEAWASPEKGFLSLVLFTQFGGVGRDISRGPPRICHPNMWCCPDSSKN